MDIKKAIEALASAFETANNEPKREFLDYHESKIKEAGKALVALAEGAGENLFTVYKGMYKGKAITNRPFILSRMPGAEPFSKRVTFSVWSRRMGAIEIGTISYDKW